MGLHPKHRVPGGRPAFSLAPLGHLGEAFLPAQPTGSLSVIFQKTPPRGLKQDPLYPEISTHDECLQGPWVPGVGWAPGACPPAPASLQDCRRAVVILRTACQLPVLASAWTLRPIGALENPGL